MMQSDQTLFKPTAPGRKDVIGWINEAWTDLSKETIINGFVKAKWLEDPRPSSSVNQLVQRLFSLKVSEDLSKALNNQHVMSDEESGDEEEAHTGEIRDVDEAQEDDQEEEAHTEDDSEDYSEDESE